MEGEFNTTIKVTLSIFASLYYCYSIPSKIHKPIYRLISLLPIISLFTLLPFLFSSLFPTAIISVFISWCANFKLILFAFHSGPLSSPLSFIQFISIGILPIKFKPYLSPSSNSTPKSPISILAWPLRVLLLGISVKIDDYSDQLGEKVVLIVYCCVAYLLVDIVFGIGNAVVCSVLNLELDPPSDQPYLATSLQDFWGKRWNLMITNLLRYTVYKPARRCLDGRLGKWSAPAAVVATFAVSGLMHELLFYQLTRVAPTWEVTCFFLLQGICLVVDNGLRSKLGGKWGFHWVVSTPLAVGFVVVTAMWLFFPPVVRTGATRKALQEFKVMFNFVTTIM